MRALVQNNRSAQDFKKTEIDHLAEFLDINIADLDELSVQEQVELFRKLVAISQLKLTRLALRQ